MNTYVSAWVEVKMEIVRMRLRAINGLGWAVPDEMMSGGWDTSHVQGKTTAIEIEWKEVERVPTYFQRKIAWNAKMSGKFILDINEMYEGGFRFLSLSLFATLGDPAAAAAVDKIA